MTHGRSSGPADERGAHAPDPAAPDEDQFDPIDLVRRLYDQAVDFIVIGGVAARAHGSPSVTSDLDICYERSRPNLERLAGALRELHATLRGADASLPFRLEARTLEMRDHFTFSTDAGDLDCLGVPTGTGGFSDLNLNAVRVELVGMWVKLASLDDLIRMKRAAGRLKDRVELEILGALRDELERDATSG